MCVFCFTKYKVFKKMNHTDIQIIDTEKLYDGFFCMKRYKLRHRLFDGKWGPVLSREVFEREPVAAIIPYDPKRDTVVLIEQFRPGPMAAKDPSPWTVEIVAGIIEKNESPRELAYRETLEETGGILLDIVPIYNFYTAPGGSSEFCHLLCGHVDSDGISGIHGNTDEGENIKVFVESREDAFSRIETGSIANGFSIIALQWLMLNWENLQRQWT